MNIEGVLKKAGFSSKEVEIYLSLLKLGSSIVSDIAKKAAINRSTTYVILDALVKRGLVSVTERRGIKVYHSISPEQLIQYLESSAKQYSELANIARDLLPKLKLNTTKQEAIPKIQLFEDLEDIKLILEEFEKNNHKLSFSKEIGIFDNKIIFTSIGNNFVLTIESKELVDNFKKTFKQQQ